MGVDNEKLDEIVVYVVIESTIITGYVDASEFFPFAM
jgi:hypothetical protein